MASRGTHFTGPLRFSQTLTFATNAKSFQGATEKQMQRAMLELAKKAQAYARENVAPGIGPSIHPHELHTWHTFTWEDTGDLAESVGYRIRFAGFRREVTIYTDLEYGMYLEIGFRGPSGRFYRYPWMKPAYEKAQKELPQFGARALRQAIEEATSKAPVLYDDAQVKEFTDTFKAKSADPLHTDKETTMAIDRAMRNVTPKKRPPKLTRPASRAEKDKRWRSKLPKPKKAPEVPGASTAKRLNRMFDGTIRFRVLKQRQGRRPLIRYRRPRTE